MRALLVGVGHRFRGDDAAGPAVAELVAAAARPDLDVIEHHGEGTDLMDRWSGYDGVIIVDATCCGGEPGTIGRWDAAAAPLPAGLFPKGSHVFGLAEAVEMARLLGRLPKSLVVIGIEGRRFSAGESRSPEVDASIRRVAESIIREKLS